MVERKHRAYENSARTRARKKLDRGEHNLTEYEQLCVDYNEILFGSDRWENNDEENTFEREDR